VAFQTRCQLTYPYIWKKLEVFVHFRDKINKNPMRQNVDKEKQELTGFGIFYKSRLGPSYEFYSS
jgi:hypothetical protein